MPARRQIAEHGVGERGRRACAGDNGDTGLLRRSVERADAGDKAARVAQVDIVDARFDGGFDKAVGACLKRSGGIGDGGEIKRLQVCARKRRAVAFDKGRLALWV
jgi:hypothetical protein